MAISSVAVTTALAGTIGEPFDLILVGVKSYSLDEAMDQFAPAVGPNTMILPVLNGIGHLDRLIARFGAAHVMGGMANISAGVDAEGRITQFVPLHDLVYGEIADGPSERTRGTAGLFRRRRLQCTGQRCRDAGHVGESSCNWAWAPGSPA